MYRYILGISAVPDYAQWWIAYYEGDGSIMAMVNGVGAHAMPP
jgi:hypothetical protein